VNVHGKMPVESQDESWRVLLSKVVISLELAPRKVKEPTKVEVQPVEVVTMTVPGLELARVVGRVRTVTILVDCERIVVGSPSSETDIISRPVPKFHPVIVTLKQDNPTALFGRTLSIIPTDDWKFGDRVGRIEGLVVG
jgi:hypothetical protein